MSASVRPARKGSEAEPYKGREASLIKHLALSSYLERLLMIVGQRFDRIAYIDCFAGPWEAQHGDLRDTSPGIAVNTMTSCETALQKLGRSVTLRSLFIEADKANADRLEQFSVSAPANIVRPQIWAKEFQDAARLIPTWLGRGEFAIMFVDPFGWKDVITPELLAPFLDRKNTELLITLMSSHMKLATGHDNQATNLAKLCGPNYKDDRDASVSTEDHLTKLYCERLKEASSPTAASRLRTACLRVDHIDKKAPFFHLVYATHNARGLITFLQEADRVDKMQQTLKLQHRFSEKERRSGQGDMFGAPVDPPARACGTAPRDAWLRHLPAIDEPIKVDAVVMADIAESAGCPWSDLMEAGMELLKEGVVENIDAKGVRRVNPVKWDAGEHLVRRR